MSSCVQYGGEGIQLVANIAARVGTRWRDNETLPLPPHFRVDGEAIGPSQEWPFMSQRLYHGHGP
eukprot:6279673-Pyramimonas_sp.AAC.1